MSVARRQLSHLVLVNKFISIFHTVGKKYISEGELKLEKKNKVHAKYERLPRLIDRLLFRLMISQLNNVLGTCNHVLKNISQASHAKFSSSEQNGHQTAVCVK